MARKPHFTLPGVPQHVIQRGNNREPCLFTIEDYRFYLGALHAACHTYCCSAHAYVLMTNHVHLLATHRAGMVDLPSRYPCTSCRYNALGQSDMLVFEHEEYCALERSRNARCQAYRELFRDCLGDDEIRAIRTSVNKELVYGSGHFKDKIERMTQRHTRQGISEGMVG